MDNLVEYFPELKPWLDLAIDEVFALPTCEDCGKSHWYPRGHCPFCASSELRWRASNGSGVIYAFSYDPKRPAASIVAYVKLDDGPTILASIVDADPDRLRIGQRMEVTLGADGAGYIRPRFAPVA